MSKDAAYREAEKKIEEAQRSGTKKLDLSVGYGDEKPKLTELPESLRHLTQLQSLDLSNNQLRAPPEWLGQLTLQSLSLSSNGLTALPEWLSHLTQLQALNLSRNQLTALPDSLRQLTQLQSLDVSSNQLTTLSEWIGQLPLQSLNLSSNGLTALPEWLSHLTQLQALNLSSNQLTALSDSLRQLTQLQSLDVSSNQLTTLPEWIGQLPLQALNLSSNQLTALPDSLRQLTQLQSLDVSSNQLTALPEWIGQLPLQSLNLSSNGLTALPEWLSHLTQLQALNLSSNQLTALPDSLRQLTQLQSLDLRYNQLTALPESLGQLTQLQSLDLSTNQLPALPESLGQLTQLQSLNFSNNQLTALPDSLGQLTQLQSLNLSNNQLTALLDSLGQLTQLQSLDLSTNQLTALPESLGQLTQLQSLDLSTNQLTALPDSLGQLTQLQSLNLSNNQLTALPDSLGQLTQLHSLSLHENQLTTLSPQVFLLENLSYLGMLGNKIDTLSPKIGQLKKLEILMLGGMSFGGNRLTEIPFELGELENLFRLSLRANRLSEIPSSLSKLKALKELVLDENPLNPELAAAYGEGVAAVKRYLRAKAEAQVVLNEAKLILIGEGEVGKSALLGALRGDDWVEKRDSTHGIEIKPVKVSDPATGTEITLNGWDFGGQRVYRPTHQLFFSAPAVYLVVWKPREGPQQGFVKDWIKLVKHREPEAKILVVATHGGPKDRQPDIDRQEIWDLFGKERVIDFFFVDSKPDVNAEGSGIAKLRDAIARIAAALPEVGRSVPKRWQEVREALKRKTAAYLPLEHVLSICLEHKMGEEEAQLFVTVSHRLGHLIHYEHDPTLRDIVVLRPDWLATAVSFVLDDKETRGAHGLVTFGRLSQLWDDPKRSPEFRYPRAIHQVLLSLMERFDLSYPVSGSPLGGPDGETSLIAQLVPDIRPQDDLEREWSAAPADGDEQQVQICRIVDAKAQSAPAEGLFYQLIVRLHKFSLGRENFDKSVHWQRGLVLDDDYNGRALLEHIGNDVKITARAAYPGAFLAVLTREVKWLVESFWEGLRCDVMVPCIEPCGRNTPGMALYEVEKLIESKRKRRPEYPCPVCDEWQDIDCLLQNAPAARRSSLAVLFGEGFEKMLSKLDGVRGQLTQQDRLAEARFQALDQNDKRIMSQVDDAFRELMRAFIDEAKEGPRLFSFEPVEPGFFDRPKWMNAKFRLTLWCEHSRRPLWFYSNGPDAGVYTIDLPREWLVRAAPFLKVLASTLGLLLPVVAATARVALPEASYKGIEAQLALGKATAESLLKGGGEVGEWLVKDDDLELREGTPTRAAGGVLRQLHAWLKEKDPTFGGLVRVQNKRREFLWVHASFEAEY